MRILVQALALSGLIATAPAFAQTQSPAQSPQDIRETETDPNQLPEKDTVATRQRPEYDPQGTRLGGFFLYPNVAVTETYRDNINFSNTNEDSDLLSVISPALAVKSNWNNHALNFSAGADVGLHASNTQEDYQDWRLATDGRLDILRDSTLTGGFRFTELHEGRSSPDQTGASEPVIYRQYGPTLEFNQRFNRLRATVGGDMSVYDFDDATTRAGATINMDDRDRTDLVGTVRLGYEIVPQYEAFVRGSINQRNYDAALDDGNFDRDSSGWETVVGVALDLGGVTFGNIYAGYMRQSFDDARLETVAGPSYGGDVTWNPTRLTSLNLLASRTIDETTLAGAAGALSTRGKITADHELLRNLILTAGAEYINNKYEGTAREDDILNVGPGADYLLNRYLRLRLRYTYSTRDSTTANADYDVNSVMLRVLAQY